MYTTQKLAGIVLATAVATHPVFAVADAANDLFTVAADHYSHGRWQFAADEFRAFLKEHPNHESADTATFYLGETLVQLKQFKAALEQYVQFVERCPDRPQASLAKFRIGETAYLLGHYKEARDQLEDFSARYPEDSRCAYALTYLGELSLKHGAPADAERYFTQSLDRFADGPLANDSRYGMARSLVAQGHPDVALPIFRKLVEKNDSELADDALHAMIQMAQESGQFEQVDDLVEQFIRRFPESSLEANARRLRGRSLLDRGNYRRAIEAFQQLVSRTSGRQTNLGEAEPKPSDTGPAYGVPHESENKQDRFLLALALLGEQRYADAIQAVEQLPLDDQEHAWMNGVHVARAAAHMGMQDYAAAVEPLRRFLASHSGGPDVPRCHADLTDCLAQSGRFEEAAAEFKNFQLDHGSHALFLPTTHKLAEAAYSHGQRAWARELFAILARDGNPPEYIAKGLSGVAWCQLEAGDAASATTFDRLLNHFPDSQLAPEAALTRARVLERNNQPDAALATYHVVFDKYPQSEQTSSALLGAARLHDRLHQDQNAERLFRRIIEQYPDLPELDAVLYQWAWVLSDLGRDSDATAAFSRIHREYVQSSYWADSTYRLAERALGDKNLVEGKQLADELLENGCEGDLLCHVLYLHGQLEVAAGHWQNVSEPLGRLVIEFPRHALRLPAEYWIAEALYRQGDYQLSGERFDTLIDETEHIEQIWPAMARLRRAQIFAHQKQWQDALRITSSIAESYPSFPQLYEVDYLLGRCLAAQGQFDEARSAYRRVTIRPTGAKTETAAMAQWMIGESYFHQKKYNEAIRAYMRVEILYDYPRWRAGSLLQAAKCYQQQEQWTEAVQLYARLLKEYADSEFAEEASRGLRVASLQVTSDNSP